MAALRFLADESCDFAVVRALRGAGYDVVAVAEFINQSLDSAVFEQAQSSLLTLVSGGFLFSGSCPVNASRTLAVSPARNGATGRPAVSSIHFVMGADVG